MSCFLVFYCFGLSVKLQKNSKGNVFVNYLTMKMFFQWFKPSNAVFVIALILFFLWGILELFAFASSMSVPSGSITTIFTWPAIVYENIKSNYFRISYEFDDNLFQKLSANTSNEVVRLQGMYGLNKIVVNKQGLLYQILRPITIIFFIAILLLNFYLIALTLYWFGWGVKKIVIR